MWPGRGRILLPPERETSSNIFSHRIRGKDVALEEGEVFIIFEKSIWGSLLSA